MRHGDCTVIFRLACAGAKNPPALLAIRRRLSAAAPVYRTYLLKCTTERSPGELGGLLVVARRRVVDGDAPADRKTIKNTKLIVVFVALCRYPENGDNRHY